MTGEVASLQHELRDDPMELGVLVAKALFVCAKLDEVLHCLGNDIVVKLEPDLALLV